MAKKTRVSKVKSSNKKRNRLKLQGKLKNKRNKKILKSVNISQPKPIEDDEEVESDHGEDLLKMVEKDDLDFIKKSIKEGAYSTLFQNIKKKDKKRKLENNNVTKIEGQYEENLAKIHDENSNKRTRYLLPIKTKKGLVNRSVCEEIEEDDETKNSEADNSFVDEDKSDDELSFVHDEEIAERDLTKPISTAEMLLWREKTLANYKFKIGLLSSALLEDPQNKVLNIQKLLDLYDEWQPEIQVTLKKLVIVSMLEVFKDIIPSYQIKHQDESGMRLKKETKLLQMSEKSLLKGYRGYLTKLEKLASKLYKKKGDTRVLQKHDIMLAELAIKCFCDLLVTHYHFNYSKNIVNLLTPYLDNKNDNVRTEIENCYKHIFINDKRGEITLDIVRRINDLVKTRKHVVKCEVISVLSNLNIKNINLDDEKDKELNERKALAKKSRIINLSKRERKRQKRLKEVEQELLETKAEENKQVKQKLLTEVTKVVFTIYFRVLKSAPTSGLLSTTLQGLAKFAHCINIEFYEDLVRVLDKLMSDGDLKIKEQLNCALTIFSILSGDGQILNIDPNKFYVHLYKSMLGISAGSERDNCELLLKCLEKVIIGRRKKITHARLLAFIKRLCTVALQVEHHVSLACLGLIKQLLQVNKQIDLLLDVDTTIGQGIYLPDLEDPEHCNASSTALYELFLLQKHYNPVVRKMANYVAGGGNLTNPSSISADIMKLNCLELFNEFNPSEMAFKPSVPVPKKSAKTGEDKLLKNMKINENGDFMKFCNDKLNLVKSEIKFLNISNSFHQ